MQVDAFLDSLNNMSPLEKEAIDRMSDQILAEAILNNLRDGVPLEIELAGIEWETIERIAKNNKELRDYLHDPTKNNDFLEWAKKLLTDDSISWNEE